LHLKDVPVCVAEVPAETTLVIVQNGRLLGVSNEATPYGGITSTGARTPRASADPLLDRETNTKATSASASANLPVDTPVDQSTLPKATKIAIGNEAHLPKVMTVINQKGVLGIGKEKDNEEKCTNSVFNMRKPRNYQPNTVYLAVPCPTGCDECHMTKYGSLYCTKSSSKYVKDGAIVENCSSVDNYFDVSASKNCVFCTQGCKTCATATTCTTCITGGAYDAASSGACPVKAAANACTDKQYYNGSACTACTTANCALCPDNVCKFCEPDHYMKIVSSAITCVPKATGCGTGLFANDQGICEKCDSTCTACSGPGENDCLTCVATKPLLSIQKLALQKFNEEANLDQTVDKSKETINYQIEASRTFPGKCVADNTKCALLGFGLRVDNNVCVK
jgi:hypothetical protein